MDLIYRPAREADQTACLSLLGELGGAGQTPSEVMAPVFMTLLTGNRGEVIVAEEAGQLLGLASVSYNLAMRYGGEYCQLEELIVSAAARGKNLGAGLVNATLQRARERGCAEYGLYLVEATRHNQGFYEKLGFAVVGAEMRMPL